MLLVIPSRPGQHGNWEFIVIGKGGGGEGEGSDKSSLLQLLPTHVQTHSIPPLLLLLDAINNNITPAPFARHFDTAATA